MLAQIGILKTFIALWPLLLICFVGVGAVYFFKLQAVKAEGGNYQFRKYLLSKGELAFYHSLCRAVDSDMVIMCKVRLADLFDVKKDVKNFGAAFNKIKAKHIDFVLCDSRTVSPVVLIELDDSSHRQAGRVARDMELAAICDSCKVKLLRVRAKSSYDANDLRDEIAVMVKPIEKQMAGSRI